MFRMLTIVFITFLAALHAMKRDGFDGGLGIGYRRDGARNSLSNAEGVVYKERDQNLNAVELDGYFRLKSWSFLLSSRADFGWYVSGRTRDVFAESASGSSLDRGTFSQSAGGFFGDAEEAVGYICNLFFNRRTSLQIVLQAGYSAFYQNVKHWIHHPEARAVSNGGVLSGDLSHSRSERLWQGPCIGGELIYSPVRAWSIDGGYFYYFLTFKQTFSCFEHVADAASEFFIKSRYRVSGGGVHGQGIFANLAAQIAERWKMNWRSQWYVFAASNTHAIRNRKSKQIFPAPAVSSDAQKVRSTARWHSFSTILEVEYFF